MMLTFVPTVHRQYSFIRKISGWSVLWTGSPSSSYILSVSYFFFSYFSIAIRSQPRIRKPHLFFFPPAKIRWIWSPRLKAWLNSSLVWNSETNGNQASTATGAKMTKAIMYSYPRARAFTDPHILRPFTTGLQACAIWKRNQQNF